MAKPELGTKRVCPNCGAKYYDLNRSPITCPRCGTVFEERVAHRAVRPEAVAAGRPAPMAAVEPEAVELDEEAVEGDVELVPLEEAEEDEAAAGKGAAFKDENEELDEFTQDIVEDEFIEDEEEDDVAGFIEGEVDEDEEER